MKYVYRIEFTGPTPRFTSIIGSEPARAAFRNEVERVRFGPIFEYIWPDGVGPRVAEPALMLIDPYPWSAPLALLMKPFTPGALARRVREVLDAPAPGAASTHRPASCAWGN